MTLPARFSLLHSDLNDFLFASVGDEQNGMALNVISALTRLGIDPWEEAARLAALPKALAAEALAPMIARLPVDRLLPSDNLAISHRLVELLPMPGQAAPQARKRPTANDKRYFRVLLLFGLFCSRDGGDNGHLVIRGRPGSARSIENGKYGRSP